MMPHAYSRFGGLLGGPPAAGGGGGGTIPGTWTLLGRGSAVILGGTNTTLDVGVVADGDTIFPGFPTQRNLSALRMFSETTNAGPSNGTGRFMVQKSPAVPKSHNYQIRTFATAGVRTFDWSWYTVS